MSTFDERARAWDTPERRERAGEVAEAIRTFVPLDASTRAIEIGAGTGLLGLALADDLGELVLAEPSQGMMEVILEKLAARHRPNVTVSAFDLVTDPPPPAPFDLAISLLVLHHLEDTQTALVAILRLLRPGGRFAIADLDTEDGSFHGPDAEGIHHLGFDRVALADGARAAGAVEVSVESAGAVERGGRVFPMFVLLGRRG